MLETLTQNILGNNSNENIVVCSKGGIACESSGCDTTECPHYKPHEEDYDGFTRLSGDYWSSCKHGECHGQIVKCIKYTMPDFINQKEMEI